MPTQVTQTQTLESVYQPVLNSLGQLLPSVSLGCAVESDFQDALNLLETLLLATSEFGVARLRLSNANHYRINHENGAAAWEIRTVMLQLRAGLSAEVAEPRVRNRFHKSPFV